jgi:hypothetical protein
VNSGIHGRCSAEPGSRSSLSAVVSVLPLGAAGARNRKAGPVPPAIGVQSL